jgi:hypothetical protein
VTEFNLSHNKNAPFPIVVTELGIVIDVNPDCLNVSIPILVRDVESVTDDKLVHPKNVPFPILVTVFPINTDSIFLFANAVSLIVVYPNIVICILVPMFALTYATVNVPVPLNV